MTPDDAVAGNLPERFKCIRNADHYPVYPAYDTGTEVMAYEESTSVPSVEVSLPIMPSESVAASLTLGGFRRIPTPPERPDSAVTAGVFL